jgi:rhamnulokinase
MIAVDLGAESCRVSLLRCMDAQEKVELVHRFPNGPIERNGSMFWDLQAICNGVEQGLRQCAAIATEGICSIGVDGWAVDYVRLDSEGAPLSDPFCYRDPRTNAAFHLLHKRISVERLYELTGIQPLRINTLYQLYADGMAGVSANAPWINLPEYILHRLGGARVAEYTNATHTGLVDLSTRDWNNEIFDTAGLDMQLAPRIVATGTVVGKMHGALASLPAFRDTVLVAPACHDTASAIAGIDATEADCAYISSGTWSLVGALLDTPCNTEAARLQGFTNLGGTGGKICFHKNVNAMWLLRQCIEHWKQNGTEWAVDELIERSQHASTPDAFLDLDDSNLIPAGDMPARINSQRQLRGLSPLAESPEHAPLFASLIFHSLAHKYAQVLDDMKRITGKSPQCIYVVGGGSQNHYLNQLTSLATNLDVYCGKVESSTSGNFALQKAALGRA